MTSNDQTNKLIKWIIVGVDFVVLNFLIWLFADYHPIVSGWGWE